MCFTAEGQVRTSTSLRTDGICQRSYICSWQAGTHLPGPCSQGFASCSPTCIRFGHPGSHGKNRFLQKAGPLWPLCCC